MTLPCPHCGTCDTPVLSPGTGPHALRASCRHCGRFIKWLPKALVRALESNATGSRPTEGAQRD